MAELLVCPKGAVGHAVKRQLAAAGVILVEVNDPSRIKFIRASEVVSSTDLLWAAMSALQKNKYSGGDEQRQEFTNLVFKLIDADFKRRMADATTASAPVGEPAQT